MQYVALLQERVKKRFVLKFVQLRCAWQLSSIQEAIKTRKGFRVPAHVVLIADTVNLIGIK